MNWKALLTVLCLAFFSSGCLFANYTTVLDTDADRTELGDKIGRSRFQSVLWLVAWGDGGMHAAAKATEVRWPPWANEDRVKPMAPKSAPESRGLRVFVCPWRPPDLSCLAGRSPKMDTPLILAFASRWKNPMII